MRELVKIGIGYRRPLDNWISEHKTSIDCLEVTAEHFFEQGHDRLEQLSKTFPIYVHGLGLSLGTPGPLEAEALEKFSKVSNAANATWISEHIAFTRTSVVDLGYLNAIPLTEEYLNVMVEHALAVSNHCKRPIILENITSHMAPPGNMRETEFINRLCQSANAGLLLDATNLFINSKNHNFRALEWLHEINPEFITQLHAVGYGFKDGLYCDSHSLPIQDEILDLIGAILDYSNVKAIILERDDRFGETDEVNEDLRKLRTLIQ